MEKIDTGEFSVMCGFSLEGSNIHVGSARMNVITLDPGDKSSKMLCDFQVHLVVLHGKVKLKSDGKILELKSGCLISILPGRDYQIQNLSSEKAQILLIQDDPVWVLKKRRSVRRYSNLPIPKTLIEKILNLSRLAPSGGNLQPWRMFAISDQSMKERIAAAAYNQEFLKEAPWIVVVCAVPSESEREYGIRGRELYSIQDTAALTTYIILTAKAYGLDTCWVGAFKEDEVSKILDLPKELKPVSIIPIGYGREEPSIPFRKPLNSILKFI